jgi:proline iminopeptidase
MKVKINGVELFFDVHGQQLVPVGDHMEERPTIVLLHGGPGFDHSCFKPCLDSLAEVAQLVYLDMRGNGRSDSGPVDQWNIQTWAEDIAAFCQTLSIKRPILMGYSFGGIMALATAVRFPELASRLVIVSSAAILDPTLIVRRFAELGGTQAGDAALAMFQDPSDPQRRADYFEHCIPLYARTQGDPEHDGRTVMNPEVTAHFFRPGGEFWSLDFLEELRRLPVPTLMLHGRMDPIVPVELAQKTVASFPDGIARLHVFDNCSHDVLLDKLDRAVELTREFIEAGPPKAGQGALRAAA